MKDEGEQRRMAEKNGRRAFGQQAEERAARYLVEQGCTVIARNWRCAGGELDIVARDGAWLVFVEVRGRRGDALGSPEESVTPAKQARLARLATAYVAECGWDGPWRIDVLALHYDRGGRLLELNHYRDAVHG